MAEAVQPELGADKTLLLVDDDEPFLRRLAKAMEKRGFEIETADSVAGGKAIATARPPAYAVVDLRLEDGNGLSRRSRSARPTICQNPRMRPTSPTPCWPPVTICRPRPRTR